MKHGPVTFSKPRVLGSVVGYQRQLTKDIVNLLSREISHNVNWSVGYLVHAQVPEILTWGWSRKHGSVRGILWGTPNGYLLSIGSNRGMGVNGSLGNAAYSMVQGSLRFKVNQANARVSDSILDWVAFWLDP